MSPSGRRCGCLDDRRPPRRRPSRSVFVEGGLDALRHPHAQGRDGGAADRPLADAAAACPDDPELLVRANGAAMWARQRCSRRAVSPACLLVLAATLAPDDLAGHAFWQAHDPAKRAGSGGTS